MKRPRARGPVPPAVEGCRLLGQSVPSVLVFGRFNASNERGSYHAMRLRKGIIHRTRGDSERSVP